MRNNTAELIKAIALILCIGALGTGAWVIFGPEADPVEKCRQSAVRDFDNGRLESTSALDDALAACEDAAG